MAGRCSTRAWAPMPVGSAWESILSGPLAGQRLTSMIVTHFHPDHVGLAGWLADRFGLPLSMPRPEYLYSLALQYAPGDLGADMHRPFYRRHGLSPEVTEAVLSRGHEYLRRTTGVPTTYHRIQHGDLLQIGARAFQVITGGGHALEQAMLYRPEERLFFAADQVIARISPNVSVHAMEPDLDALGIYLRSLAGLRDLGGTGRAGAAGSRTAVLWPARTHRRTDRAPRATLRRDRRCVPTAAALSRRHRASRLPSRAR